MGTGPLRAGGSRVLPDRDLDIRSRLELGQKRAVGICFPQFCSPPPNPPVASFPISEVPVMS
jgi:hypothetical protein